MDELATAVIGAAIEVHKNLGPGFLEEVYEEALAVELQLRRIPFQRQYRVKLAYKGYPVGEGRLDFFVDNMLVVEVKAVEVLAPIFTAQTISYLKAVQKHLGLLINFNVPLLKQGLKRIIYSEHE